MQERLQKALKMGWLGRRMYPINRCIQKRAFQEYEWLLEVSDMLQGKPGLKMSFEDRARLVAEEAGAHLQEVAAALHPYYRRRTYLKEELNRLDAVIVEERIGEVRWKGELREVNGEWSRMEALVEAEDLSLGQLNGLTVLRRRLLDRQEAALGGLGVCQQRLSQTGALRDKMEDSWKQINSQILVYELRQGELAAYKQGVGMDYRLGMEKGGLSKTSTLDGQSKAMRASKEAEGGLTVEDGSNLGVFEIYPEEEKSAGYKAQLDFDQEVAERLNQSEGGRFSKKP